MWYSSTIDGYWFEAKVYNTGSIFGILEGRISKLHICEGNKHDRSKEVYSYDRGLDFDNCPPSILVMIIDHCQNLSLLYK